MYILLCVPEYVHCVGTGAKGSKATSNARELELQTVVSHLVGAVN